MAPHLSLVHTPLFAFLLASVGNHPSHGGHALRRTFWHPPLSGSTFDVWSAEAVRSFNPNPSANATRDDKAWALRQLWALYQEVPWWDAAAAQETTPHAVAAAANLAGFMVAFVSQDTSTYELASHSTRDVSVWLLLANQMLSRCRLAVGRDGDDDTCLPHYALLNAKLWNTRTAVGDEARVVGQDADATSESVLTRYQLWTQSETVLFGSDGGASSNDDLLVRRDSADTTGVEPNTECRLAGSNDDPHELLLRAKHGEAMRALPCLELLNERAAERAAAAATCGNVGELLCAADGAPAADPLREAGQTAAALAVVAMTAADQELQRDLTTAALMRAARAAALAHPTAPTTMPKAWAPMPTPAPTLAHASAERVVDAVRASLRAIDSLEATSAALGSADATSDGLAEAARQLRAAATKRADAIGPYLLEEQGSARDVPGKNQNEHEHEHETDDSKDGSTITNSRRTSGVVVGMFVLRTPERSHLVGGHGPALGR